MKKSLFSFLVWALWVSSFGLLSHGQSSVVKTWTVMDGMPDNDVSALLVDGDGVTWIGTQNGIVQFDGATFRPVEPDIGRDIRDIVEAPDGSILVAEYRRGLFRVDRYTREATLVASFEDPVLSMTRSPDGTVWVGTLKKLYFLSPGSIKPKHQRLPIQDMEVRALLAISDNEVWVGGPGGYGRVFLDAGRWRAPVANWRATVGSDSVYVSSLAAAGDGRLWIGTQGHGLQLVDPVTDAVVTYRSTWSDDSTLANDYVYDILPVDESVWVAGIQSDGHAGLSRLDLKTQQFTRYRYRPADPESVGSFGGLSLAQAPDGSILAGFLSGGLSVLSSAELPVRFWHDGARNAISRLPAVDVGAVLPMDGGFTLVGMLGDGLYRRENASGEARPLATPASYITALEKGEAGSVWMGAWQGLYRLDNAYEAQHIPLEADGSTYPVMSMAVTGSGTVWVGSRSGWVFRVDADGTDVQSFRVAVQDRTDRVEGVAVDHRGRVWAASGGRLFWMRLEDDGFSEVVVDGLDTDIRFVDDDPEGDIWLGTRSDGLVRLDPDTGAMDWYTEQKGMLFNGITGLLVDAHGCVVAATDRGINGVYAQTGELSVYPSSALTPSNKFGVHRLAIDIETDVIYMAGLSGIVRLDANAMTPHSPPLDVRLSDVLADGHLVDRRAPDDVVLDSGARRVILDVSVPVYTRREDVRYRYRLAWNSDWIELDNQHLIDLSAAGPGRHMVDVQASSGNSDGPVRTFSVTVQWPWWQAPWMRVVWVLLLVASVVGAAARRMWRSKQERLRLERTVAERTATVREQADRLKALDAMKSRFFANISHEFRTPLTLILGPVEDALSGRWGDMDRDQEDDVSMIRRQGRRLLALVNQLLDLATLDAGRMTLNRRPQDIVVLTRTAVQAFSSLAESGGVTLRFKSDLEQRVVQIDPERMEQVLYNLVGNAIKFTPEGGSVMVSVEETDEGTRISVRDTGPGIAAAKQSLVFDRFYQVEREGSARRSGGIGLALARELVELHGGRIVLESDPGFGATFAVMLPGGVPVLEPVETPEDASMGPDPTAMLLWEVDTDIQSETKGTDGQPVVLIVEDHPDVASYIARSLSDSYRCHIAGNGDEGLEWARQLKPDLVVSDVMMPGMDGYALCQAIKSDEQLRTVPVILLTARADEESKMEGLGAGADDYLYKPFSGSELRLRAENLIEVRRILRDSLGDGGFRVQASNVDVQSDDELFARKAQEVVEGQLDNTQFGATWLADELGISPRHLQRRLKDTTGLSTNAFIRTLRLQRAHQLLDKGAGNVSEVAYAVGYTDPKYFSRIFRQAYGVPPSQIDS